MRKTAIVTGATGYIGSKLCKRLIKDNWNVYAIVRPGSKNHNLENVSEKITFFEFDNNFEELVDLFQRTQADIVYHLATAYSDNGIDQLINSNIKLGLQILEAMKVTNTRFFVNTGTYWQHYNSEEYNPLDLYSATKQAFQDIIKYYTDAGYVKAITLKLFDTYGPEDNRPKLINFLYKFAEEGTVLDMSPGEQKINYVYIDDVVNAYIKAYEYFPNVDKYSEFAVASQETIQLKELIKLFEKLTGKEISINWGGKPYKEREMMVPWEAYKLLPNWGCVISLKEGLLLLNENIAG